MAESHWAEGDAVLDVAGGVGEPSLTIAEKVGPAGFVICTDAVAEMVAAAQSEAARRGAKIFNFNNVRRILYPSKITPSTQPLVAWD